MSHLPFTITAYFFNALAVLANKFLLQKTIPDPLIYTFYISLISLILILVLPFTNIPTFEVFNLASASTLLWTAGAYFMFKALKIGQVSRVIPIIGTLIPLILLGVASETSAISINQAWAVLMLIVGIIFLNLTNISSNGQKNANGLNNTNSTLVIARTLSERSESKGTWQSILNRFLATLGMTGSVKLVNKQELVFEILSAVFFAFAYIVLRQAYLKLDFFSVLVWSRLILIPAGILMLAIPILRRRIITPQGLKMNFLSKEGLIFAGGQISGTISEFLLLFSISLANPALVNSLQGTQYVFLIIFALILSKKYPAIFKEKYIFLSLVSKIVGIGLIGAGLYLLAGY